MTFLNAALLFGLAAVVIPPVVHLFNRRKFDEVDWAAMQFLVVGPSARRKLLLEQFLLMLLRIGLIAALVLAFASPQLSGRFLGTRTASGPRHVVILVDGSGSMGFTRDGKPEGDSAKAWAIRAIDSLADGDRVAIFQVTRQTRPIVGTFTADHALAKGALELLAEPGGTADWPRAVQAATTLLVAVPANRHILILSDNQKYNWADETTLAKWELFAQRSPSDSSRIWVADVAPDRPSETRNASLEPLTTGRAIASAGRDIEFRTTLNTANMTFADVGKLQLEVDGRAVQELVPNSSTITFKQKFSVGSHLVTVKLPPDALPSDNRQDFALEVLATIPVLIVDGASADAPAGDYLRDALAPAKDPSPAFAVRTARIGEWSNALLLQDVKGPGTPPRVLVLANIEKLSTDQQQHVEKFLNGGGSVLVTLGDRVDAALGNRIAFRGGRGFLPARLIEPTGDEADPANAKALLTGAFAHPALDIFRDPLLGGLHTALFPRYWKVDASANVNGSTGTAIALFNNREPFLVERSFGRGRVILATHALDHSWRTNFHRLPDFVRFAHELLYYLAGSRAAERNLEPGHPILYTPSPDEPPGVVTLHPPSGPVRTIPCSAWPAVLDGTDTAGAYRVVSPSGRTSYYCVRPDPNESVLTPCTDDDRERVRKFLPQLRYVAGPTEIASGAEEAPVVRELWWMLLVALLGFLVLETWYTRALSRRGES